MAFETFTGVWEDFQDEQQSKTGIRPVPAEIFAGAAIWIGLPTWALTREDQGTSLDGEYLGEGESFIDDISGWVLMAYLVYGIFRTIDIFNKGQHPMQTGKPIF